MKINARLNDEIVSVQVVKRGDTVYMRRTPKTVYDPTEKQLEVRQNVALAAMQKYEEREAQRGKPSREDINHAVATAFRSWVPEQRPMNRIESMLEDEYGSQVSDVKTTYLKIKRYNYP